MNQNFYRWDKDALTLFVLVTAGARTNQIGKIKGNQLKISIMTAPEKGKATAFLIQFLADLFGVPKKSVELMSGELIPSKQIKIYQPKQLPDFIKPNHHA